jgi:predicted nucleotidyltransferase
MSGVEQQLSRWAKPPSETEETKCQNTVNRIKKAITSRFGNRVSIFLQGSYKNRTNVRLDSDVDIVVRYNDAFYADITDLSESDKQIYEKNRIHCDYIFLRFKNDIKQILEDEFDSGEIEHRNKCITVKKNTQRVNADVLPCFVHKRFRTPYSVSAEGIQFFTDDGTEVISFPEQHYENGVSKNEDTARMYKAIVRILKNIRNELIDRGKITENLISSFYLECLIWNVPNNTFNKETYLSATKAIIEKIFMDMSDSYKSDDYAEVSDLLWLFKGQRKRTPQQARDLMLKAWDFLGLNK